jgi:hypothetical protein
MLIGGTRVEQPANLSFPRRTPVDYKAAMPRPSTNHKLFVIGLRCGRLANRLVIFATFIALAEEYGYRVINVTFHSYAKLFETTRRDIYCRYPAAKRRSWMDIVPGIAAAIRKTRIFYHIVRSASVLNESHPLFGKSVMTLCELEGRHTTLLDGPEVRGKIHAAKIIFPYGWRFRAPALVQKHAKKIRNYFRPIEEIERSSRQAADNLRRDADVVVGVHIRQGDYRRHLDGKFFFPASRYADWMREMAAQFPGRKVSFFVCSDEPRNAGEFPGLSVGFGVGQPVADLYTLAKCDYILGPVSTFSQWASFYGKKPLLHFYGGDDRIELGRFHISDLDLIE